MDVPSPDRTLQLFLQELKTRLGPDLVQVWLFGSRARGEATDGSDYDILIIARGDRKAIRPLVLDAEWACMEQYASLVSSIIYTPELWSQAQVSPLGMNILKEGKMIA